MIRIHTVELLVEANKKISNIISKAEKNSEDKQAIIDGVNDVISQLDNIVEELEKK